MEAKKWTVTPFLTPEHDDDPLGVYKVQPVFDNLTARYEATNDFDLDTAEGSEKEEEALATIHAENAKVAILIEAAPDLLAALENAVAFIIVHRKALPVKPDSVVLQQAAIAIAKARGADPTTGTPEAGYHPGSLADPRD